MIAGAPQLRMRGLQIFAPALPAACIAPGNL
jgi:hypothetical protein